MINEKDYLTNAIEEIKNRLGKIEETLYRIESMEKSEIEYINAVKDMELKELENLDDISQMENHELAQIVKLKPLKYNDVMLWKNAIWENCAHKMMIESKTTVSFNCELSTKVCSYNSCPRNIVGSDK